MTKRAILLKRLTLLPVALQIMGVSAPQSAIEPGSSDAELVAVLWWAMLAVATAVLAIVLAMLLAGTLRVRHARTAGGLTPRVGWIVVAGGGVALPVVAVLGLVVSGLYIGRTIATPVDAPYLTVEITGRQWWWEIVYPASDGVERAVTANELHVPVDREVRILLKSDNVIHSFWIPSLQGKTDLIPGRVNETRLRAAERGVYRGQCAEFCGVQHAYMGILVVAEPAAEFAAWRKGQAESAAGAENSAGFAAFMSAGCGGCHAIRGTAASGSYGPDLTHMASRQTLAAATIPNTRGHLAGWIADPQHIKPGNKMPVPTIPPEDFRTLVRYLESLR